MKETHSSFLNASNQMIVNPFSEMEQRVDSANSHDAFFHDINRSNIKSFNNNLPLPKNIPIMSMDSVSKSSSSFTQDGAFCGVCSPTKKNDRNAGISNTSNIDVNRLNTPHFAAPVPPPTNSGNHVENGFSSSSVAAYHLSRFSESQPGFPSNTYNATMDAESQNEYHMAGTWPRPIPSLESTVVNPSPSRNNQILQHHHSKSADYINQFINNDNNSAVVSNHKNGGIIYQPIKHLKSGDSANSKAISVFPRNNISISPLISGQPQHNMNDENRNRIDHPCSTPSTNPEFTALSSRNHFQEPVSQFEIPQVVIGSPSSISATTPAATIIKDGGNRVFIYNQEIGGIIHSTSNKNNSNNSYHSASETPDSLINQTVKSTVNNNNLLISNYNSLHFNNVSSNATPPPPLPPPSTIYPNHGILTYAHTRATSAAPPALAVSASPPAVSSSSLFQQDPSMPYLPSRDISAPVFPLRVGSQDAILANLGVSYPPQPMVDGEHGDFQQKLYIEEKSSHDSFRELYQNPMSLHLLASKTLQTAPDSNSLSSKLMSNSKHFHIPIQAKTNHSDVSDVNADSRQATSSSQILTSSYVNNQNIKPSSSNAKAIVAGSEINHSIQNLIYNKNLPLGQTPLPNDPTMLGVRTLHSRSVSIRNENKIFEVSKDTIQEQNKIHSSSLLPFTPPKRYFDTSLTKDETKNSGKIQYTTGTINSETSPHNDRLIPFSPSVTHSHLNSVSQLNRDDIGLEDEAIHYNVTNTNNVADNLRDKEILVAKCETRIHGPAVRKFILDRSDDLVRRGMSSYRAMRDASDSAVEQLIDVITEDVLKNAKEISASISNAWVHTINDNKTNSSSKNRSPSRSSSPARALMSSLFISQNHQQGGEKVSMLNQTAALELCGMKLLDLRALVRTLFHQRSSGTSLTGKKSVAHYTTRNSNLQHAVGEVGRQMLMSNSKSYSNVNEIFKKNNNNNNINHSARSPLSNFSPKSDRGRKKKVEEAQTNSGFVVGQTFFNHCARIDSHSIAISEDASMNRKARAISNISPLPSSKTNYNNIISGLNMKVSQHVSPSPLRGSPTVNLRNNPYSNLPAHVSNYQDAMFNTRDENPTSPVKSRVGDVKTATKLMSRTSVSPTCDEFGVFMNLVQEETLRELSIERGKRLEHDRKSNNFEVATEEVLRSVSPSKLRRIVRDIIECARRKTSNKSQIDSPDFNDSIIDEKVKQRLTSIVSGKVSNLLMKHLSAESPLTKAAVPTANLNLPYSSPQHSCAVSPDWDESASHASNFARMRTLITSAFGSNINGFSPKRSPPRRDHFEGSTLCIETVVEKLSRPSKIGLPIGFQSPPVFGYSKEKLNPSPTSDPSSTLNTTATAVEQTHFQRSLSDRAEKPSSSRPSTVDAKDILRRDPSSTQFGYSLKDKSTLNTSRGNLNHSPQLKKTKIVGSALLAMGFTRRNVSKTHDENFQKLKDENKMKSYKAKHKNSFSPLKGSKHAFLEIEKICDPPKTTPGAIPTFINIGDKFFPSIDEVTNACSIMMNLATPVVEESINSTSHPQVKSILQQLQNEHQIEPVITKNSPLIENEEGNVLLNGGGSARFVPGINDPNSIDVVILQKSFSGISLQTKSLRDGDNNIPEVEAGVESRIPFTPNENTNLSKRSNIVHIIDNSKPDVQPILSYSYDVDMHNKLLLCLNADQEERFDSQPISKERSDAMQQPLQYLDIENIVTAKYQNQNANHISGISSAQDSFRQPNIYQHESAAERIMPTRSASAHSINEQFYQKGLKQEFQLNQQQALPTQPSIINRSNPLNTSSSSQQLNIVGNLSRNDSVASLAILNFSQQHHHQARMQNMMIHQSQPSSLVNKQVTSSVPNSNRNNISVVALNNQSSTGSVNTAQYHPIRSLAPSLQNSKILYDKPQMINSVSNDNISSNNLSSSKADNYSLNVQPQINASSLNSTQHHQYLYSNQVIPAAIISNSTSVAAQGSLSHVMAIEAADCNRFTPPPEHIADISFASKAQKQFYNHYYHQNASFESNLNNGDAIVNKDIAVNESIHGTASFRMTNQSLNSATMSIADLSPTSNGALLSSQNQNPFRSESQRSNNEDVLLNERQGMQETFGRTQSNNQSFFNKK